MTFKYQLTMEFSVKDAEEAIKVQKEATDVASKISVGRYAASQLAMTSFISLYSSGK